MKKQCAGKNNNIRDIQYKGITHQQTDCNNDIYTNEKMTFRNGCFLTLETLESRFLLLKII